MLSEPLSFHYWQVKFALQGFIPNCAARETTVLLVGFPRLDLARTLVVNIHRWSPASWQKICCFFFRSRTSEIDDQILPKTIEGQTIAHLSEFLFGQMWWWNSTVTLTWAMSSHRKPFSRQSPDTFKEAFRELPESRAHRCKLNVKLIL